MERSICCVAVAVLAIILAAPAAHAQIEPRRCDLLDGPGCNPNQCGILDGPGCQAQARTGGIGETLLLTLATRGAASGAAKPEGDLNAIRDLFAALRACWTPPAADEAQAGMQMSMRFSLGRDGKLIGEPRVTYASRDVSQRTRDLYREAIIRSLEACMPLPFSDGFAAAIAGRPIAIRIIDDRENVPAAKPPG